jgi:hypothetical protein
MASSRLLRIKNLVPRSSRAFSASEPEPIKTALYDLHVNLKGKMVPFGKRCLLFFMTFLTTLLETFDLHLSFSLQLATASLCSTRPRKEVR